MRKVSRHQKDIDLKYLKDNSDLDGNSNVKFMPSNDSMYDLRVYIESYDREVTMPYIAKWLPMIVSALKGYSYSLYADGCSIDGLDETNNSLLEGKTVRVECNYTRVYKDVRLSGRNITRSAKMRKVSRRKHQASDTLTVSTYLPGFPGFYNSVLEFDYELSQSDIMEGFEDRFGSISDGIRGAIEDDVLDYIDYSAYRTDVAIGCLENFVDAHPFVVSGRFEGVASPKEYNFVNDSVDVELVINLKALQEFINNNADFVDAYLEDNFTSYDGFMSFYDNSEEAWREHTNNYTNFDSVEVASLLECYWEYENKGDDDSFAMFYYYGNEVGGTSYIDSKFFAKWEGVLAGSVRSVEVVLEISEDIIDPDAINSFLIEHGFTDTDFSDIDVPASKASLVKHVVSESNKSFSNDVGVPVDLSVVYSRNVSRSEGAIETITYLSDNGTPVRREDVQDVIVDAVEEEALAQLSAIFPRYAMWARKKK